MNKEEEIRRALEALDHLQRVPGNPWLMTRIQARLDQEAAGQDRVRVAAPVKWAFLALFLLLDGALLMRQNAVSSVRANSLPQTLSEQYGWSREAAGFTYLDQPATDR